MPSVVRLHTGDGGKWRRAVESLVPETDRDRELLSLRQAEDALSDDRCYLLVVESDGSAVGLLSAYRFPDVARGGYIVYLYDIEVATQHRRQGFGSALVECLVDLCDSDDVDLIWAGTESENCAARATFSSTGAQLDSESYTEYEWGLD